ncbi:tetratricopeptide repeat protein, partial [bacterium]
RSTATLVLARVLISTDRSQEAERLLDEALADEDPERRSALLVARGAALARRHALAESERDSRAAIALARATGCLRLLAKARYNLATVALWAGKFELAEREAETGITEIEGADIGDPGALALTLGRVLEARGFWSKAAERYGQAVATMRGSGPRVRLAQGLTIAADLDRRRGNHDAAVVGYREAVVLWRTLGDRMGLATVLKGYGQSLFALGDNSAAERSLRESVNEYLASGEPLGGAPAMVPLARVLLADGRVEEALPFARRAVDRLQALRADASGLAADETLSVEAAKQLYEEITEKLARTGKPSEL